MYSMFKTPISLCDFFPLPILFITKSGELKSLTFGELPVFDLSMFYLCFNAL